MISHLQWTFLTIVAAVGLTVLTLTIVSLYPGESLLKHQSVEKPASDHKGTSLHSLTFSTPDKSRVHQLTQLGTIGEQKRSLNQKREEKTKGELKYLPFPMTTLPPSQLLKQSWVESLKQILSEIPQEDSSPVHIVGGNSAYQDLVLNWLIVSQVRTTPPVRNVIVLSLDRPLCDLLNAREIACVHVAETAFLRLELEEPFQMILVLRQTAIRLLNYWGYDAANLDADALVLKNLEPLYEKFSDYDMVAGRGTFPFLLGHKWGYTMCGGTFMIRSTPNTGMIIIMAKQLNHI